MALVGWVRSSRVRHEVGGIQVAVALRVSALARDPAPEDPAQGAVGQQVARRLFGIPQEPIDQVRVSIGGEVLEVPAPIGRLGEELAGQAFKA